MDSFLSFCKELLDSYSTWELGVMGAIIVLFFMQIFYYLFRYARIATYRSRKNKDAKEIKADAEFAGPEISVVVVIHDDYDYIEKSLPHLLSQDYHKYEVVIVNLGSTEGFEDELAMLRAQHPHLMTTKFEQDPRFPISNKMAFNVGIKASHYEHVILTTSDAYPPSNKWLKAMSKGFNNHSVVIGYCGLEVVKGFGNRLKRSSRLMQSVRYISSAMRGVPYRGIIQNMGFTKTLYFNAKGFNYLNLNIGEDDLFIQRIATKENTGIVINSDATMRQRTWGGLSRWRHQRLFYSCTQKFYPSNIKRYISAEIITRALFFGVSIAGLVLFDYWVRIGIGSLLLLRLLIVLLETGRICRRLGEKGLLRSSLIYDMVAPISEFMYSVGRNVRHVNGVWR